MALMSDESTQKAMFFLIKRNKIRMIDHDACCCKIIHQIKDPFNCTNKIHKCINKIIVHFEIANIIFLILCDVQRNLKDQYLDMVSWDVNYPSSRVSCCEHYYCDLVQASVQSWAWVEQSRPMIYKINVYTLGSYSASHVIVWKERGFGLCRPSSSFKSSSPWLSGWKGQLITVLIEDLSRDSLPHDVFMIWTL